MREVRERISYRQKHAFVLRTVSMRVAAKKKFLTEINTTEQVIIGDNVE